MRRFASAALAAAGLVVLTAVGAAGHPAAGPPTGAGLAELAKPPTYTALASERIYFVLTDRYANGDRSNDRAGLQGGPSKTGYDPAGTAWYHGGDLRGLTGDCSDPKAGLARIKSLGFTALWITPPFRQQYVQGGSSAAYHGYWILDFTSIDPHLGTKSDFAAFVDCAHRSGLKVYLDVVVNHTADVILLPNGDEYSNAPFRDCRGRPFKPGRYTRTRRFPCLRAANMPRVPLLLKADRHAKKPGWLNDVTAYHDRGDVDFSSCSETCFEQGDFFGLDDLFTEQPRVMNGLAAVYAQWIRTYKVDGFRVDTARHVNADFFRLWAPKILAAARRAGVPDFQIFGEVAIGDSLALSEFVRNRGLPEVLDFPLQDAASGFAAGRSSAGALADRFADDDYFRTPAGTAPTPATFLGNHDLGRAAFQLVQHGADAATLLQRVLLGYDVLYLLRGAPVVYYGDEVGIVGRGGDQAARQDLFPTQVDEWKTQARVGSPPIGNGSSFDVVDHPIALRLRQLNALRGAYPALSTGATVIRLAQPRVFVASRIDAGDRREYVAAFNAGTTAATVAVVTSTPSSSWIPLLGPDVRPTSEPNGSLSISVPALGTVLLRAEGEFPERAPARPVLTAQRDDLTQLWKLSAKVRGDAGLTVAFAVRRRAGKWTRLAADDSPPYRAFLDPARYRKDERVDLLAIARSAGGQQALSPIVRFTVRR